MKGSAQCPSEISSSDLEDSMQYGRVDDAVLIQRLAKGCTARSLRLDRHPHSTESAHRFTVTDKAT